MSRFHAVINYLNAEMFDVVLYFICFFKGENNEHNNIIYISYNSN
jgi:hypothetical protein